jgi:hypothetical protein
MQNRTSLPFLVAALLAISPAKGQNQSLADLLKGGVKRGTPPPQQAPQPQQRETQQQKQQPAPQLQEPSSLASPAAGKGFRMQLPPGWRAELTQSRAVVARSGDAASAVIIAPVTAPERVTAYEYLRQYAAPGLRGWLPDATVTNVIPSRLGQTGALASLQFRTAAGPGRAAALLFMSGGLGTLYVIGAPVASFAQQRSALIQTLRSFSFEGVAAQGGSGGQAAPAANINFTRFIDPNEGAFHCELPAGWKTQGGLVRKSTVDIRSFVRVSSPDGAIHLFVGDPDIGTFVTPNPTLEWTGFREGSSYSPGYGNVMIVRRYVPGLQFAQEYGARFASAMGATGLEVRDARPRPDLRPGQSTMAQAWNAGEVSFSCNLRGGEGAGYVLAATQLTAMYGSGLWNVVSLLGYAAPVGNVATANAVIDRMIRTFQINPNWAASQQQMTAQTTAIVSDTNEHVSKIITDSYWSRQRSLDRINRNFSDYIRGVVRLRDPETGEELEGRAGNNYYWRVRGTRTIVGNDSGNPPTKIDVTELQQID